MVNSFVGGSVGAAEVSSVGGNVSVGIGLVGLIDSMGDNDSDSVVNLFVGGSVGVAEVSSVGGNVSVGIGLEVSSVYEVGTDEL